MNDDLSEEALKAHLAMLRQDHADFDAVITALSQTPMPDLLLIGRLKRKKLLLKDEIARIEDKMTPDIIA